MADNESSSESNEENPIQDSALNSDWTNAVENLFDRFQADANLQPTPLSELKKVPLFDEWTICDMGSDVDEEFLKVYDDEENSIQDSALNSYLKNAVEYPVERFRAHAHLQHLFWETQPVVQFKEGRNSSLQEGPIEQPIPVSEVKQEPYDLPNLYEWTVCDMGSEEVLNEVYLLFKDNYVPEGDNMFIFNYSKELLRWGLCPPGYFPSWHIGVRENDSKTLVAFMAAIPVKMKVRNQVIKMAEVNFLCVHKMFRLKRLTPLMIKEITRRIHLENVWQAAYTAALFLPTPVTVCQCWHRMLNTKKLIDVGFSSVEETTTMARKIKHHDLPNSTSTPGLRKMEFEDGPLVTMLLENYLSQFAVAPIFNQEEVKHWLLPQENVVESYVVEDSETGAITDFFSFYALSCSILNNQKYDTLKAAYSFYSVSTTTPLDKLMQDALITANEKDFDVFKALNVMENDQYLKKLKFERGNGQLYYYLYNYRLQDKLPPSQIGLLLF